MLEVVLALGIFVGGIAALSQLQTTGMNAAISSRMKTHAVLRCESKLNEVAAGVEPLQPANGVPFEDDNEWTWSLTSAPGPHADLLQVTVTVNHSSQNNLSSASYSMSRLMRDPVIFQLVPETEETMP